MATNNTGTKLFMKDVDIRHTTVQGIDIRPATRRPMPMDLQDIRSRQSAGDGLRLQHNAKGTVTNSQFQGNTGNGANIFGVSVQMAFVDTDFSNNTQAGLVNASGATTFIDGCSFFGHGNGGVNKVGSKMNVLATDACRNHASSAMM